MFPKDFPMLQVKNKVTLSFLTCTPAPQQSLMLSHLVTEIVYFKDVQCNFVCLSYQGYFLKDSTRRKINSSDCQSTLLDLKKSNTVRCAGIFYNPDKAKCSFTWAIFETWEDIGRHHYTIGTLIANWTRQNLWWSCLFWLITLKTQLVQLCYENPAPVE